MNIEARFPLRGGRPRARLIRPGGRYVGPFGFGGLGRLRGFGGE